MEKPIIRAVRVLLKKDALVEFQESMMETRMASLVQKVHILDKKKTAVGPSLTKGPSQMSFLPCLGLAAGQKQDHQSLVPNIDVEHTTALKTEWSDYIVYCGQRAN